MYNELKELFDTAQHANLLGVLNTIAQLAAALEGAVGGNPDKLNKALDLIKELIDNHKKQ